MMTTRPLLTSAGSTYRWRKLRAAILLRDRGVCAYCGDRATTVDHVIARANGGGDHPSNLVAACQPCNRSKGAKPDPRKLNVYRTFF